MNRRTSQRILAIALSTILTQGAPALGQTSTTTGTQKPAEATDTIKGSSVKKKNEAVAYGKKLVSDLDVKIKDLEIQLSRDVSAAGADAKRQVNELRQLKAIRAETAKKLDEMGRASSESWNSAKQAFADSYKDLTGRTTTRSRRCVIDDVEVARRRATSSLSPSGHQRCESRFCRSGRQGGGTNA